MKIAFVNQPIDVVLPPFQTSVGACTYGLALALAKHCEVVVYGLKDRQPPGCRSHAKSSVRFVFLPGTRTDRALFKTRSKLARAGIRLSPNSTSKWQFRDYGRQVALALR